jgi:hypothetical protein
LRERESLRAAGKGNCELSQGKWMPQTLCVLSAPLSITSENTFRGTPCNDATS